MALDRRGAAVLLGAALMAPWTGRAQEEPLSLDMAQRFLISGNLTGVREAVAAIRAYGEPDIVPGLIVALRWAGLGRSAIAELLQELTGEDDLDDWFEWMLWQEAHPELVPHASYVPFKRDLWLRIDPAFEVFLRPEYLVRDRMHIRFEEITWGGVRKDGIPSLDNPELLAATDAAFMRPDDLVFGISINGDTRAYPLRIMGWHEMFNEVIGGVPLALAYCTLCGSGILFETQVEGREAPFVFGSSGFLYRSNKLMFDRETHSLWNQFTGRPVVGPLADSGIELRQRPVVITRWVDWRQAHPETRILSLNTGHARDYGSGVVYRDYFASPDLMFPTITDETLLRQKDYVFGIRTFAAAKAWPLESFAAEPVINDRIGDLNVVLVGDPVGRTVRAYDRGQHRFDEALSTGEAPWTLSEDALVSPSGETAPRVAGHIAYWFAWDGYLGTTSELYQPS